MAGICVEEDPNNNNNNNEKAYSLRPRTSGVKRGDDEDDDDVVGKEPKPRRSGRKRLKPSAPLSKYRRKTANARERSRMREINEAFDSLRRAVPGGGEPEKLTKITTLKLAMKYIAALSQALNGEQPQPLQQPPPPPPQLLQQPCPEELPSFPVLTDFNNFEPTIDFDDFFIT
ncbi:hypothetical protein AAG570_008616 [Ranatra chinensis]|uniref:BHLH domain-containing protein n=1 Tax=Ranatra chinensis TaxID=642074 RepID=A0ABD0Z8I0_9HEMI